MSTQALTHEQKLQALAHRFYQGAQWQPKAGDYYTTSRADLELYRVVNVEGGKIYTEYCTRPGVLTEWDADTFTTHGFGPRRVHVPDFILASTIAQTAAAQADNERLREALRWYEEKVAECRKIGSLGDNARQALDRDGGFRARDALSQQAKVEAMEKQEPVAWAATDETGAVVEALGMNQSRRFDTALYLAPGAQPAPKAVAYLDIGAGGYMDIGTDLNDEQLASLPKGRHMLGIVGTYGVEGYSPAQPAVQGETGWQPIETAPKDNKRPLYLAQFDEEGTLINIDFDGTWEREIESWEAPNMYYYWASAHGNIEEPTHWAYQDAGAPPQEPSHDNQ